MIHDTIIKGDTLISELPYGDQAIFLRKKMYLYVGGMPGYPIGEDFGMVEKLKEFGHIGIVEGQPCLTSSIKWEKEGYFKVRIYSTYFEFGRWSEIYSLRHSQEMEFHCHYR